MVAMEDHNSQSVVTYVAKEAAVMEGHGKAWRQQSQ